MPCNCGRSANGFALVAGATSIAADAGEQTLLGMYELAAYPGCVEPYTGPNNGMAIYVVARGDAALERLFGPTALIEAREYARSVNRAYSQVPARSLCDSAVRALLAQQEADQ